MWYQSEESRLFPAMRSGDVKACDVDRSQPRIHHSRSSQVRPFDGHGVGFRRMQGFRNIPVYDDVRSRYSLRRSCAFLEQTTVAAEEGFQFSDRKRCREFRSIRNSEPPCPATIPEYLGEIAAANRDRRSSLRSGQPARAELSESSNEYFTHSGTAHHFLSSGNSHRNSGTHVYGDFEFCCFDGNSYDEEYLDWEQEIEKSFDNLRISEKKQVDFVVSKLTGRAKRWWKLISHARFLEGRSVVKSWRRMKRLLRSQFLLVDVNESLSCNSNNNPLQCDGSTNVAVNFSEESVVDLASGGFLDDERLGAPSILRREQIAVKEELGNSVDRLFSNFDENQNQVEEGLVVDVDLEDLIGIDEVLEHENQLDYAGQQSDQQDNHMSLIDVPSCLCYAFDTPNTSTTNDLSNGVGQQEVVNIYCFNTNRSVEEEILERAKKKMVLDQLVSQKLNAEGRLEKKESKKGSSLFDKNELLTILKFGGEELFKEEKIDEENKKWFLSLDMAEILERAEKVDSKGDNRETHLEGNYVRPNIHSTIWSMCFVSYCSDQSSKGYYYPILTTIMHRKTRLRNKLLMFGISIRTRAIQFPSYPGAGSWSLTLQIAVPHLLKSAVVFKESSGSMNIDDEGTFVSVSKATKLLATMKNPSQHNPTYCLIACNEKQNEKQFQHYFDVGMNGTHHMPENQSEHHYSTKELLSSNICHSRGSNKLCESVFLSNFVSASRSKSPGEDFIDFPVKKQGEPIQMLTGTKFVGPYMKQNIDLASSHGFYADMQDEQNINVNPLRIMKEKDLDAALYQNDQLNCCPNQHHLIRERRFTEFIGLERFKIQKYDTAGGNYTFFHTHPNKTKLSVHDGEIGDASIDFFKKEDLGKCNSAQVTPPTIRLMGQEVVVGGSDRHCNCSMMPEKYLSIEAFGSSTGFTSPVNANKFLKRPAGRDDVLMKSAKRPQFEKYANYNIPVEPRPEEAGIILCIEKALSEYGIAKEDVIEYICCCKNNAYVGVDFYSKTKGGSSMRNS